MGENSKLYQVNALSYGKGSPLSNGGTPGAVTHRDPPEKPFKKTNSRANFFFLVVVFTSAARGERGQGQGQGQVYSELLIYDPGGQVSDKELHLKRQIGNYI